jgi:hypothetical protein
MSAICHCSAVNFVTAVNSGNTKNKNYEEIFCNSVYTVFTTAIVGGDTVKRLN